MVPLRPLEDQLPAVSPQKAAGAEVGAGMVSLAGAAGDRFEALDEAQ